jgi:hypothetical protein
MKAWLYKVKLNAWASPVWVQASGKKKAEELALQNYPKCDCCGGQTYVESTEIHDGATPQYTPIIMEVRK